MPTITKPNYHANTGRLGLNYYVCSKPIPGFAVFICPGKERRAVDPPKKEGVLSGKIIQKGKRRMGTIYRSRDRKAQVSRCLPQMSARL